MPEINVVKKPVKQQTGMGCQLWRPVWFKAQLIIQGESEICEALTISPVDAGVVVGGVVGSAVCVRGVKKVILSLLRP